MQADCCSRNCIQASCRAQDGGNPNVPTYGLVSGSCGYGLQDQNVWPNWYVAAIAPTNPLATGGNQKGCGTCIEVTCTAVSPSAFCNDLWPQQVWSAVIHV